nr:hypothetical protein [Tanacetum cinerariifolium]
MDDLDITMEEYIRLEEEKAQRHGRTFNWQTATYGKMEYYEDEDDCFTNFEIEYPAIVFDDTLTSDTPLSCEPTHILLPHTPYAPLGSETPMAKTLAGRLRLVYTWDESHEFFTSHAWRRLFEIRAPMIACSISGKGQAPEKVTDIDLFYLRSIDRGTANVLYLLAQYLFMHVEGRKNGARLSGGHFIGHLAARFVLVSDEGLRGLSMITHELPMIDFHELVKLNIYVEGTPVVLTHVHTAPPPPTARTISHILARLEEDVHGIQINLGSSARLIFTYVYYDVMDFDLYVNDTRLAVTSVT